MSYVLAFSLFGATDVTEIYASPSPKPTSTGAILPTRLPRQQLPEADLVRVLREVTDRRRAGLTKEERQQMEIEDDRERRWIKDWAMRHKVEEERVAREGELGGRVSGTKEWRTIRGEEGMYSERNSEDRFVRQVREVNGVVKLKSEYAINGWLST